MNFYYDEEIEEIKKLRKELEQYRPVDIDLTDSVAISPTNKIEKESYKYYMGQKNELESIIKNNLDTFLARAIRHRGYPLEIFTRHSFVAMLVKRIETYPMTNTDYLYTGILYMLNMQQLDYFNAIIRPILINHFSTTITSLMTKVETMTEEQALQLSIVCSIDNDDNRKGILFLSTLNATNAIFDTQSYIKIIEILFDKVGELFNEVYTHTYETPNVTVEIEHNVMEALLVIVDSMPLVYIRQLLMNYHEYCISNKKTPCISIKNIIYPRIKEVLSELYMEGISIY